MKKILLLFFLGAVIFYRYQMSYPRIPDGKTVRLTNKVLSEPTRYSDVQRLTISGMSFYLPLFPEINYGDEIIVEGVVENKKLKKAKLVGLKKTTSELFVLRKRLIGFYQKTLPSRHAALVSGMVIGSKESLSENFWEDLKQSGTAHVVVASGMNVSLVASFLISLLILVFPRKKAIFIALLGIWLYSFLSGFEAPIVRAAIMGTIGFGAQAFGRLYFAGRALLISILVMLFLKPLWVTDLGFILSVVATFSLMLFEAKIRNKLKFVPGIFREGLSTSLAAQIGVFPILFVTFGQFNPFSVFANALVLWTVPAITVLGAIAGGIGLIFENFGKLTLFLVYPLTSWFIFVIERFS